MSKVYIVGNDLHMANMFAQRGWEIAHAIEDADLVQFTGGSDVSPKLYGEDKHPRTYSNTERDTTECAIFDKCQALNIPMAGICRGGQFLNVMSGGKLYQDVDKHAIAGSHDAVDVRTGQVVQVTSTHHQMMRVGEQGILLLAAFNQANRKEFMIDGKVCKTGVDKCDVEAVYYPETLCLCFQPHPEYGYAKTECTDLYFDYIERYFAGFLS